MSHVLFSVLPLIVPTQTYMLYVLLSGTLDQRVMCFETLLAAASPIKKYKSNAPNLYRELRRHKAKLVRGRIAGAVCLLRLRYAHGVRFFVQRVCFLMLFVSL